MKNHFAFIFSSLIILFGGLFLYKIPSLAASTCTQGSVFNIVAHQDDDILFLNPDIIHDIQLGRCVTTLFVTAGDANLGSVYWHSREDGAKAAYAQMAGVGNTWIQTDAGVVGHSIPSLVLMGNQNITLLFLRLPDGNINGSGFSNNNYESLQKIWQGSISTISAVDGSSSYDKNSIIAAIKDLVNIYQPGTIRTHNYINPIDGSDHSDHYVTGYISNLVHQQYLQPHIFVGYYGYQISSMTKNVSGDYLTLKQNIFLTYAQYDSNVCQTLASCQAGSYGAWFERQYVVPNKIILENNIAPISTVSASSESISTNQQTIKAVDGYVDGYPLDYTHEWSSVGQGAGAYLNLTWSTPRVINKIILYDRPNLNDQIINGNIIFSNGTTIPVGQLNNDGSPVTISFTEKTINSLRLNITEVSPTTANIGLAEIQVGEVVGAITPTPTPTPTLTPTPTPISNGLLGNYFNSLNVSGTPVLTRIDPIINFSWLNGSPDPKVNSDLFSVRWTGYVKPLYSQKYTFCVGSDEGSRLWINNKQLINYWRDQTYRENCGTISLIANTKYPIKLEYYDRYNSATVNLYWKSTSQSKQIIPSINLFPN